MKLLARWGVAVGCVAGLAVLVPAPQAGGLHESRPELTLGVTALAAIDDPQQFSDWSTPVNLGPVVNSTSYDACPTISKSGLSLYFRSNRPGGQGLLDIWVAQRDSLEDSWETPINLGPTINGPYNEYCSAFSPDGHWLVFVSDRPVSAGGCGGQDLWISHRQNKRDDFGWQTPRNLGCIVNSDMAENGPAWFEDEATGRTLLYFSSARPGGPGGLDILRERGGWGREGQFRAAQPRCGTEHALL